MDDRRTDREGGERLILNPKAYILRGFLSTAIIAACLIMIAFALYGLWDAWKPQFDRSGKGLEEFSPYFMVRLKAWLRVGAILGAFVGACAGTVVAVMRSKKINPTT